MGMPPLPRSRIFLTTNSFKGFKKNFLELCGKKKFVSLKGKRHDILTNWDIKSRRFKSTDF